jgi:hypothetical protein
MEGPATGPVLDVDSRMKRLLLASALLSSLAVPAIAAPPPPPETRQQCVAAVLRETANLRPVVRHIVRERLLPRCMRLPDGRAG